MSYGRGGAGNIQAVAERAARAGSDLEAPIQPGADSYPAASDNTHNSEPQYAHSGRGGAGNYYSPADLAAKGEFAGASSSHIPGDGTPAPAPSTHVPAVKATGRGGAGNFLFGPSENEELAARKEQEDGKKAEALKESVAKGVEEQLAMPEKAKLPSSEPFDVV